MLELMEIPKTFSIITGEEEDAHELMNKFLINTRDYIESKVNGKPPFVLR